MTTSKLPADLLRARLAKRASDHIALANKVTPEHLLKTPSQKHSEAGRKRLLKRAGSNAVAGVAEVPSDCRGCTKECRYGMDLDICPELSAVLRCKHCGQKVRFRVIPGIAWEYCPVCQELK